MKKFIAEHLVASIVVAVVVVGGIGAVWYIATNRPPAFSGTGVEQGNVVVSVDEPGTVTVQNDADLSFQEPGQIANVNVQEGDTVSAGTVLASLDNSSLVSGLEQASATLAEAQANLDELIAGTRPEQLAVDQSAVSSAQASVTSASASLAAAVQSAYAAADDAVHNQTDNLFLNPKTTNPTFQVPDLNSQAAINIVETRISLEPMFSTWYAAAAASSSDPANAGTLTSTDLDQVQSYLDALALVVNDAQPTFAVSASVLSGYRTNVATGRTEVTAAITGVTTAENTLSSAQAGLASAESQLSLAQAGSTPQDIEAQKAAVQEAQAAVSSAQLAVDHASLVAPFSGTVQDLTAKIGQVVSPGAPLLSLVSNTGIKIEAYASEQDAVKIQEGDAANVTLDAYGTGTLFPATVATVDTAETEVNGSPAYQVTLYFKGNDPRIKDGMTGNVHIVTAEHDNVLEVPSRLVINDNGSYFVLVKSATGTVDQPVVPGLVGDNGMTEITSGLTTQDQLANF